MLAFEPLIRLQGITKIVPAPLLLADEPTGNLDSRHGAQGRRTVALFDVRLAARGRLNLEVA